MSDALEIDARGLRCPLPVLWLRKALQSLPPGAELHLLADDPVAVVDIPHFCTQEGHILLGTEPVGRAQRYRVRRG
ncbi:sulfurtransferase TusA family protein [Rhodovulum adriaticum]|uniref:tRNA 2-thiouridine synthesizing protein A n=1 Tax=Rhodovulum adriaticum TaxID=35804 RepID=A0A4R2NTC0_RHOAD|nr:sulfurtransferase TusA family protein [Rhodovulum adriaticum]MBK1635096.1 preprotein translocase subunit TatB [Rhodovulum adriaticum]TCP25269.1 tRNA 2-thiouridine synthesizing protein A [Rhodovulum adriaticum]